jgi:hypothetical protein
LSALERFEATRLAEMYEGVASRWQSGRKVGTAAFDFRPLNGVDGPLQAWLEKKRRRFVRFVQVKLKIRFIRSQPSSGPRMNFHRAQFFR